MNDNKHLAELTTKAGKLWLTHDGVWEGEDKASVAMANAMKATYSYTPADGYPGCKHALDVAKKLKAKVKLADVPTEADGLIY